MSFRLVGKRWNLARFRIYLKKVDVSWASSVTIHHTGAPSLGRRPKGLLAQHIINIRDFYRKVKKWSRGPHLFVDRDEVLGMSPLSEPGIHAVSFNRRSIAIETLGNYDEEDPKSGRGLECFEMAAGATAIILKRMGKPANKRTIKFHRDDRKTSKSCPGDRVDKDWFIELVKEKMGEPVRNVTPVPDVAYRNLVNHREIIAESILWQTKQLRKSLQDEEDLHRLDAIEWQARKLVR